MTEGHDSGVHRYNKSSSQHKKRTYDIIITAEFWNTLGKRYTGHDAPLLRITWKDVEDGHSIAAATTRWTLHTTGNNIDILMQIGSAAFTRLHHFVDDLENEYGAELLHIMGGLTFVFRHRQPASDNKMVADKDRVIHRFKSLLRGLGTKFFYVSFDGHGETGRCGNSDSALAASGDPLQLLELERRLEKRMVCQSKNMENVINNVIWQTQSHIGNEIRSLIHAKQDTTPRPPTPQSETRKLEQENSPLVTTDKGNDLSSKGGGKGPLSQYDEFEEVDGHTQKASANLLSVSAEVPSKSEKQETANYESQGPPVDVTSKSCNESSVDRTLKNSRHSNATAKRSQSFQHYPSRSETISKNRNLARDILRALTISLNGCRAKPQPPRSKSASTVLCLDVSGSIGEHGFQELKAITHSFIDGIESVAERYGLEENIGVVTVGGEATVAQDLTNDYGAVRDIIDNLVPGGPSPLFAGLVVSVASIKGRTGILSVGGVHKIKPRIIFLTDGYATSDSHRTGQDALTPDSTSQVQLIQLTTVMARQKADTLPVTWVPVGKADRNFLSSLAQLGKQELVDGNDIHSLCNWYRLQDTTGKLFICLSSSPTTDPEDLTRNLDTAAEAVIGDMTNDEKAFVIQAVKDKLEGKSGVLPDDDPSDFDNVFEREGLPPLGSRVQRGPDWSGEDEDVGGDGTIINHSKNPQLVWVRWDFNGDRNIQYSYGYAGQYEVLLIDSPRRLLPEELVEIGVRVQRGIDWSYRNQDGGHGSHGMIIRTRADGKVKVRWVNGHINVYNFGCHGRFDLEISSWKEDVSALEKGSGHNHPTQSKKTEEDCADLQTKHRPHIVWQWKDEGGNWRLYSKKQIEKLNKEYVRKPARSCVLQKKGQSIRVLFKEPMLEKSSNDSNRHEVRRVAVSSEDLDQLIQQTTSVDDVGWTRE